MQNNSKQGIDSEQGDVGGLITEAWQVLTECEPKQKVTRTFSLFDKYKHQPLNLQTNKPAQVLQVPGRPDKPRLVFPRDLPRRRLHSTDGRAALLHALCHIEFNAINLAWDAVYRFRGLPEQYYRDWMQVAKEEAYHFSLIRDYLNDLGYEYGDFPAHNALWEMAVETAHDAMVRMALVPRVLEARGLDVTPGIIKKFADINDARAVEILEIINCDEIGHVKIGSYWFRHLCEQRQLDHDETFYSLLKQYLKGGVKPPLAKEARLKAGFTQQELDYLEHAI